MKKACAYKQAFAVAFSKRSTTIVPVTDSIEAVLISKWYWYLPIHILTDTDRYHVVLEL